MLSVFVYAVTLVVAVLVSRLAERTVLSTALLFLAAGALAGRGMLGLIVVGPDSEVLGQLTAIALFSVLFTDGMRAGLSDLRSAWRLPGRALFVGLPLTLLAIAVIGRFTAGLPWAEALLVGAALSATDPVLAAALVGKAEVPWRLRHLLNVESGLNDGIALPIVLVLIALLGHEDPGLGTLAAEAALGIALGIVGPWVIIGVERSRFVGAAGVYEPLLAFAVGLLLFATGSLTHANLFLAAFAGGVTVATLSPRLHRAFRDLGQTVTELLKLAALLVFGSLLSPAWFGHLSAGDYLFAALVLVVARPLALAIALFGTGLEWREWVAAAWFGPKGFASVLYGLLVLDAGLAGGGRMFQLIATVTVASIVLHSSTDVLVARWFRGAGGPPGEARQAA
jgi:NhaP-type Na+/H+ or K+/H+ antiporter